MKLTILITASTVMGLISLWGAYGLFRLFSNECISETMILVYLISLIGSVITILVMTHNGKGLKKQTEEEMHYDEVKFSIGLMTYLITSLISIWGFCGLARYATGNDSSENIMIVSLILCMTSLAIIFVGGIIADAETDKITKQHLAIQKEEQK